MPTNDEWAVIAAADKVARDASLTVALDVDAAEKLVGAMSDLSERCWCAGWLSGLEYTLWSHLDGTYKSGPWGQGEVTDADVAELRDLHERCGGWWYFDDKRGEIFVATADWLARLETDAITERSINLGTA